MLFYIIQPAHPFCKRKAAVPAGCVVSTALLTQSPVLFAASLVFQIAGHRIILAEERWCIRKFGNAYVQYMKNVRRYL